MIHQVGRGLAQLKARRLAGAPGRERRPLAESLLPAARGLPTRSMEAAVHVELADAWLDEAPARAGESARHARSLVTAATAPNLLALALAVEANAATALRDPEAAFALMTQAVALARLNRAGMNDPILRATSMRERIHIFLGAVAAAQASGRPETALALAELARPSLEADPEPMPVGAVQAALAADEMVLAYTWLGPARLLVGVIEPGACAVRETTVPAPGLAALSALAPRFRDGAAAGWRLDRDQADALDWLVPALLPACARAALRRRRRVYILAHRTLHALPFGLLRFDGTRLGLRQPIAMIPNLRSLVRRLPADPDGRAVIAGISRYPAGQNGTPPFAAAAAAAADRHAAAGRRATLLPEAGARDGLLALAEAGALDPCGLLLLACHGASVQGDAPGQSFLMLGADRLEAAAIERLRLRADLVFLAACCSGQRAVGGLDHPVWPGDDLFGLQAALWRAGARQVVGALWNADVDAAARMAGLVHAGWLRGADAAQALHEAARELARRPLYAHNHDWATFVATVFGLGQERKTP